MKRRDGLIGFINPIGKRKSEYFALSGSAKANYSDQNAKGNYSAKKYVYLSADLIFHQQKCLVPFEDKRI